VAKAHLKRLYGCSLTETKLKRADKLPFPLVFLIKRKKANSGENFME
jgi:hypothetical protein